MLLKDPECSSGWGLNQRPPARKTSVYPIELEVRWNPTYLLQIYNLRWQQHYDRCIKQVAAHLGALSRVEECIAGASYRLTLRWFWPSSSSIRVCACPWQWVFSQCRTPVCIPYWGTELRRSWKEDQFGSLSLRSGQTTRHIAASAEYLHDVLND